MSLGRDFIRVGAVLAVVAVGCGDRGQLGPRDASGGTGGGGESGGDPGSPPDTSCQGPGVSAAWPVTVQLDQTGCAARPPAACSAPGGGPPRFVLDTQLLRFAQVECSLPSLTWVMVNFVSGCPSVLQVQGAASRVSARLVDCLTQHLQQVRWSCAETVTCSLVEFDTLP